jgi:putative oxidoreductase
MKAKPIHPDAGLFLVRAILGVVFVFHGAQKLFGAFGGYGIEGTAGFFASIGIPFPTLSVWLAGGTELVGGLLLLLGLFTLPAGALLAATMLVAALTAHSGFAAQNGGMEYPLTLAVVSLGLALAGPGAWTVASLVPQRSPLAAGTSTS